MKQKDGFSGERSIVMPQMVIDMEKGDPLASSLYITDIGYYPKAEHHYRERKEAIEQHVLIFCMEGTGWYRVDGKEYHVEANQFFILPAGKPHVYASDTQHPWTIYWVHFSGEHAGIYADGALAPQSVKPNIHSRICDRINIFEEIFTTLASGCDRESLRYASSLLHYYLASVRYVRQFRNAGEKINDTNVVAAAIHYMKENIEKKLTLKDLADYTGYSSSHFSSLFKEQTGHSPLNYLTIIKIQQACAMLDNTNMKINQICFKVGIEDCYYFSRVFSKQMGMSPKQYREAKKG
ncbi:MAG: AraC family transcriptional regulator [Prevotellaceae bacterium]|nr:AraC family transcriptional regulator [Prevotellaceae bacterium]